jgi:hypothetical protein
LIFMNKFSIQETVLYRTAQLIEQVLLWTLRYAA